MKAVSEAITTLILISIAMLAGYMVYRAYTLRVSATSATFGRASEIARSRIAEKLELVEGYIDANTSTVHLIVYNYGRETIGLRQLVIPVIVNGSKQEIRVIKLEVDIPKKNVTEVKIRLGDDITYPRNILVKIVLFTDSNRRYEYFIRTI